MKTVVEVLNKTLDEMEGDNAEYSSMGEYNERRRWAGSIRRAIKHIEKLESLSCTKED